MVEWGMLANLGLTLILISAVLQPKLGNFPGVNVVLPVVGEIPMLQCLICFLIKWGKKRGFKARNITASSCVTILKFDIERLPEWARKSCKDANEYASICIASSLTIIIAAMWQYQLQSQEIVNALKDFLSQMQLIIKKVLILWHVPMFDANIQRILRF